MVNVWIFVFLAKQNISTDWEPKNSAEKPVQLASTFSLFFSAALKILLGFSQQLQKIRKNSNVLDTLRECDISRALFFKILTTLLHIWQSMMPNYTNKKVYLKCNAQICTDISLVFFSIAIGRWLKLSFCLLRNNLDKTIVRMCTSVAPFTVTNVRTNCKSAYCKKTIFLAKEFLNRIRLVTKKMQHYNKSIQLLIYYISPKPLFRSTIWESILNSDHVT